MVGVRYTLVWPEDQVGLAPTGAQIRGSPPRVGRIDRSHLGSIGFGVVGPTRRIFAHKAALCWPGALPPLRAGPRGPPTTPTGGARRPGRCPPPSTPATVPGC